MGAVGRRSPRAALEVIKTELFLELLMRLLDPARLDGTGNILDRRVGEEIGEIVFSLAVGTMLAHQPDPAKPNTSKRQSIHISQWLRGFSLLTDARLAQRSCTFRSDE